MGYLKIIFYGLLVFIERHPLACIFWLTLLVVPPILWPVVRWIMLGFLAFILICIGLAWWKIRSMKRKFEKQYSDMMNGNQSAGGTGFSGFSASGNGFSAYGFQQGMSLEDFVRQMQREADARQGATQQQKPTQKEVSDKGGEYVDFEEIE